MSQNKQPPSRFFWACAAALSFSLAAVAVWGLLDGDRRGELPRKHGEPVRKIGHEAEFDIAAGKYALMATMCAAFGAHATFQVFRRKEED